METKVTLVGRKNMKPKMLAALYNASRPLGLGILHYRPERMTEEEAAKLLEEHQSFDYLKGRVMKVSFERDELNLALYDRDNGPGAGYRALLEAGAI